MRVLVLGTGPVGLMVGAALGARGHEVIGIDRDPGPAPDGTWPRRGVMQFEHAHAFRPQVGATLQQHWPAAYDAWLAAGAEQLQMDLPGVGLVPAAMRSRRSTFERALRAAASDASGLTLRTGHVDDVLVERGRVVGAVVDGTRVEADLVVDASGRSSRLGDPDGVELEGSCGMAYVDRTYQLLPGAEPGPMDNPVASVSNFDGYQVLVFLHERGHFSVLFVRPTADRELTALHGTAAFEAACAAVPVLAAWTDPATARPTSPVMVGGALRNRYRRQRDLPGLVTVGDAVATTTPTRGRGVAMGAMQVAALLHLLDDGDDPTMVAGPFGRWCDEQVRPWVEDHVAIDSEAVEAWQGAGLDLGRPLTSTRICDAAQADPRIGAHAGPFFAMVALPSCLAPAEPLARAVYETGWRAPYSPGPSRDELVDVVRRAAA